MTVSPTIVETSSSDAVVTVRAVVTDDLSGVVEDEVFICMTYWDTCYASDFVGGDTYQISIVYPQYSGSGVDREFSIEFRDRVGNTVYLSPVGLLEQGFNLAVGLNDFSTSYPRTVSLDLTKKKARGVVDDHSDEVACSGRTPVTLERKARTGWRVIATAMSAPDGSWKFPIQQPGRYRITAPAFGLGTPTVTTCGQATESGRIG
jgi:hypothetical protein